jgi:hypothetical protein
MTASDQTFWDRDRFYVDPTKPIAMRQPSQEELDILTSQHPFLELACFKLDLSDVAVEDSLERGHHGVPAIIEDDNGWVIQYWPSGGDDGVPAIISVSCSKRWPHFVSDLTASESVEGLRTELSQDGTTKRQAFAAVFYAISTAMSNGWKEIHITDGYELPFFAWCLAEITGVSITGYNPTVRDHDRRDRIQSLFEDSGEPLAPSSTMSLSRGNRALEEDTHKQQVDPAPEED